VDLRSIPLARALVLTAAVALVAVPAQAEAPAAAPAGPPYVSPEVHADRTVTFRIQAPHAAEVLLEADWLVDDKPKLAKDAKGLWSVTLGPLPSGVFIYSFKVDGVATPDPLSPDIKLRARSAGSFVRVHGDGPDFWDMRDVPHGTVEVVWHRAASLGGQARMLLVYTPPGYGTSKRKLPVLYLLHGNNGTAADWTQGGLVNFVMDNLLADKKVVPMIIVMPWLHALPFDAPAMDNNDAFNRYLLEDVVPFAEARYRVLGDRAHRAVFGLSRGGAAALTVGLGHLELFSHVAGYSIGGPEDEIGKRILPALEHAEATNARLRLLWIGCGKRDALFPRNEGLANLIAGKGVKLTFQPTDGVHNWTLWREYFHATAPLLFR
jgi:enterochelin esterase-like enzyme